VCLAVLRAAVLAGHTGIYLLTDDHRLPAIRTYLRLGFRPRIHDDATRARWEPILAALNARPR
jgi:mycothiol synthase